MLLFKLNKETKGALQYKEIAADGQEVTIQNAAVGTLYVRKSFFTSLPKELKVTVECE